MCRHPAREAIYQGGITDFICPCRGQVFFFAIKEGSQHYTDKKIGGIIMLKKRTKKIIASLLSLCLLLSLGACGKPDSDVAVKASSPNAKTVAIIQAMDNPAFDDMRKGIISRLQESYGDNINIVVKNAQGDATNLQTIVQGLINDKVDILVPIGTPAAQACINMETSIPTIFCSVSDPVRAGLITDFNKPNKNATGTSNLIPTADIINMGLKLTPEVKSFGFIYNTGEDNSVSTIESVKKYLNQLNIPYEESVVTNSSEVQQAAQNLIPKVDALFVPNDAMVQSAMPLITDIARQNSKPIYASSAATVASGALATLAMGDEEIGKLTANMVIEALSGKALTDIPTFVVPGSHVVVNEDFIKDAKLTIPQDLLGEAELIKDSSDKK